MRERANATPPLAVVPPPPARAPAARERAVRPPAVSLIIPAHNEEARLRPTLWRYGAALTGRYGDDYEILVVANGCTDGTEGVAAEAARALPQVRLVTIREPVGKGGAVAEGFRRARGARVAFADADAATAPESLIALIERLDGCDVSIGSRRLPESVIVRAQPLPRRIFGTLFAWVVAFLFGLPVRDTQCGAKAFRQEAVQRLVPLLRERRWAFDLDLLLSAELLGLAVVELPVVWEDQPGSRLRILPTMWEIARSLWRTHQRRVSGLPSAITTALAADSPAPPGVATPGTPGHPVFAELDRALPLGQLLLRTGAVSETGLREGLALQRRAGVRLGEALVSLGHARAAHVARAVAHQRGIAVFNRDALPLDAALRDARDEAWYRERRIIPFAGPGGTVRAVTADATDPALIAAIGQHAGRPVQPVLATNRQVETLLYTLHRQADLARSADQLRERAPDDSADRVLIARQRAGGIVLALGLLFAFVANWLVTLVAIIATTTVLHIASSAYRLYLYWRGYAPPAGATAPGAGDERADDRDLPVYTILVPLYQEAVVIPQLTRAIRALDWPAAKLDVRLLLEEDDTATIAAARDANLPSYFTFVIVPAGGPRGKPKACNYGLAHARGEYVVIFDAEDIPEPDQLRKVYAAFQAADPRVACIQCRLNFYNPEQNLLTRWFTSEYSMWFDLLLPGLQRAAAPIPLGGTSNHFRAAALAELGAWDPYNVTEDADLGIRLFKRGYATAVIDSTTYEEANPAIGNWIRQRSRWIKGYAQTWLVHMRHPVALLRALGPRGFLGFQAMVGGTVLVLLLNPFYWALTVLWFASHWAGIEQIFPAPVFYLGGIALYVGNFAFVYLTALGAEARGYHWLVKYALLNPLYWALMSAAAWKGVAQLAYAPSYWEKTQHGLARIAREQPGTGRLALEGE
jgi:cellulose synthase/poly-beta-1,6-N-acetylglucosamine synthase-like glycosyltransferase